MLITITKLFKINVPKFTDELDDLVGLHQLNFQDILLDRDAYDRLNNQIIRSDNSNWNKAIALLILNQKKITTAIFNRQGNLIELQHHITCIVEYLATEGIDNCVNRKSQDYNTFIRRSVKSSMKLLNKGDDDYNTEIVDPICLTREIDKVAYCKPNQERELYFAELKQSIEQVLQSLDSTDRMILELRYLIFNPKRSVLAKTSYKPLIDGTQRSIDEISKLLNMNKEKTRQLIKRSLRKANHPSRTVLLKDYFSDIPFAEIVADEHNTLPCSW